MEDGGEERRSLTQLLETRGQSKYAFTFSLFIRFRWVWKYDTCIFGMPETRSVVFLPHLSRQSTSKYIYEGESLFYSNQMIRIANKKACLFEELWSSISRRGELELRIEDKITPENNICARKLNEIND